MNFRDDSELKIVHMTKLKMINMNLYYMPKDWRLCLHEIIASFAMQEGVYLFSLRIEKVWKMNYLQ